jgi:hypothetical protein
MAERLIPGAGYIQESRQAQALVPGDGYVNDPGVAATQIFLSGPSLCVTGTQSDPFTVTVDGLITTVTVTPSDGGAGGSFLPTSVVLTTGTPSAIFTYTAAVEGTTVISVTNSASLTNPAGASVVAVAPPAAAITSIVVSGESVLVTATTSGSPTSAVATLNPAGTPNGAVTKGPASVTLSAGTATIEFQDVEPGDYAGVTMTMTNPAGSAMATGSAAFSIVGMSGSPVMPAVTAPPPADNPVATIVLGNHLGAAAASLTNLKWAFFDQATPDLFAAPTCKGAVESTAADGTLTVDLVTTALVPGQVGWLIVTDSDGTTGMVHKAFSGPVVVA